MSKTGLFLLGMVVAVGATTLPIFTTTSNCGGNSAALSDVHRIALAAVVYASDPPDHSFCFTTANSRQRGELAYYGHTNWCRGARFLVSTAPLYEHEKQQRRIIAVCDTPYRNVPRQWIGSAPPTHAAGYSDGSYGLIFTEEFAALDRTRFIPIDELYAPQSK